MEEISIEENNNNIRDFFKMSIDAKEEVIKQLKKDCPTWSIRVKDVNEDPKANMGLEGNDDCINNSFFNWFRLNKIGVKRCRGIINNKNVIYNPLNKEMLIHYWVQSDKYVFNENVFLHTIVPIQEYYELYQISDVEIADDCIFTSKNKRLKLARDTNSHIKYYKDFLIYKNKKLNKNKELK